MSSGRVDSKQALSLAFEYHRKGNLDEAEKLYNAVIELESYNADAHHGLGLVFGQRGQLDFSLSFFKKALMYDPNNASINHNMAEVYRRQEDYLQAEAHYTRAINIDPYYSDAYGNLGITYKELERFEESEYCYKKAIELDKKNPRHYNNMGNLFSAMGRFADSVEAFRKAVDLQPDLYESIVSMGIASYKNSDFDLAEKCYRRAIELRPDFSAGKLNLALIQLRKKNFREGLKTLEARFEADPQIIEYDIKKKYDGKLSLAGKTLLIHNEKAGLSGFGDTVNFGRYVLKASKLGAKKIIFRVQPSLKKLFAQSFPDNIEVVDSVGEESFDAYIPLVSLPLMLKARAKDIPFSDGFLKADEEGKKNWKEKCSVDAFKIGFMFKSHAEHIGHAQRSVNAEVFKPLADIEGVKLFSFQKYDLIEESGLIPEWAVDLGIGFLDFADTAAALSHMDMVVTIDSALLHVAGAAGVQTEVILTDDYDWRWFNTKSENTPWYDSVSLNYKNGRSWEEVIIDVAEKVKAKLG